MQIQIFRPKIDYHSYNIEISFETRNKFEKKKPARNRPSWRHPKQLCLFLGKTVEMSLGKLSVHSSVNFILRKVSERPGTTGIGFAPSFVQKAFQMGKSNLQQKNQNFGQQRQLFKKITPLYTFHNELTTFS